MSLDQQRGEGRERRRVTYDLRLHFWWVICSFATCGKCCCLTGLITLLPVGVNVFSVDVPCSSWKNYDSRLHIYTQSMNILAFKLVPVFPKPLGQNCLPRSVARTSHSWASLQSEDNIAFVSTTASSSVCRLPLPSAPTLHFPHLVNEN